MHLTPNLITFYLSPLGLLKPSISGDTLVQSRSPFPHDFFLFYDKNCLFYPPSFVWCPSSFYIPTLHLCRLLMQLKNNCVSLHSINLLRSTNWQQTHRQEGEEEEEEWDYTSENIGTNTLTTAENVLAMFTTSKVIDVWKINHSSNRHNTCMRTCMVCLKVTSGCVIFEFYIHRCTSWSITKYMVWSYNLPGTRSKIIYADSSASYRVADKFCNIGAKNMLLPQF